MDMAECNETNESLIVPELMINVNYDLFSRVITIPTTRYL
jgi:hypothetical protein